jgi:hypothetical protein
MFPRATGCSRYRSSAMSRAAPIQHMRKGGGCQIVFMYLYPYLCFDVVIFLTGLRSSDWDTKPWLSNECALASYLHAHTFISKNRRDPYRFYEQEITRVADLLRLGLSLYLDCGRRSLIGALQWLLRRRPIHSSRLRLDRDHSRRRDRR